MNILRLTHALFTLALGVGLAYLGVLVAWEILS